MRISTAFYIMLVLMLSANAIKAQISTRVPDSLNGKTLDDLAKWTEEFGRMPLYYHPNLGKLSIQVESDDSLGSILHRLIREENLHLHEDPRAFLYLSTTAFARQLPSDLFIPKNDAEGKEDEARSGYLGTISLRGGPVVIAGTKQSGAYVKDVTIHGKVRDGATSAPIFGATIRVNELGIGASSDADGRYSLTLPQGKYSLTIRTLEMDPMDVTLIAHSDDQIDFEMSGKVVGLREVIVSADARSNVERPDMGIEKLSVSTVNEIPRMMGEPDIVKAALLLPGVQSVAEGTGQLNVRGAPSDQNIFYLDEIPVYNTTHLMGFFSAFTPNALNDVSIYKSSLPSKYGGRLSSVFDIGTSPGNKDQFKLKGGISPITADLQVEGPALNNKLTYMSAVRSTYSSWVLNLIDAPGINGSNGAFQDAILRFKYDVDDKNSISTTGYFSRDEVQLNGLSDFAYENRGASVKWNRSIRYKHTFSLSAAMSNYAFREENVQTQARHFQSNYQIRHIEGRAELVLRPFTQHTVHVGLNSIRYDLNLGGISPLNAESLIKPIDFGAEQALESGIYLEETWTVNPRITLKGGARLNLYQYLGPNSTFVYTDPHNRSASSISDTLDFAKNDVIMGSVDPDIRISGKYSLNELTSIKASVSRAHQYVNVLSNTVTVAPSARWKLADQNIQPMMGWHYSIGLFKNIREVAEASIELYYKEVEQLVDFKDGANLVFSPFPEMEVLQGDLTAFGVEFMLRKSLGKLSGWFNYTFARSFVQVEGINDGVTYPSNFDKPHSVNLAMHYQHTTRMSFSMNLVYASGRPITYPTAVFYQSEFPLTYFSSRNEFRIPDYMRCDIGMSLEGSLKAKKKFHGTWHFSVYNLFGRDNPFSVFAVPEDGVINGYQLSIFGSPIPSIAYQFKLGNYAR
ncbi:MAG: TonB-dependent receptor [Cryomorphaceae bacterium]